MNRVAMFGCGSTGSPWGPHGLGEKNREHPSHRSRSLCVPTLSGAFGDPLNRWLAGLLPRDFETAHEGF